MSEPYGVNIPELADPEPWARHIIQVAQSQTGSLVLSLKGLLLWEPVTRQVNTYWLPKLAEDVLKADKQKRHAKRSWQQGLSLPGAGILTWAARFGWAIGTAISNIFRDGRSRSVTRNNIQVLFNEAELVRAGPDLSEHERTIAIALANMALHRNDQDGYLKLFEVFVFLVVGGGQGAFKPSSQSGKYPEDADKAKELAELVTKHFFAGIRSDHEQWTGRTLSEVIAIADGTTETSDAVQTIAHQAINLTGSAWATAEHLGSSSSPFKHMEWGKDLFLGNLIDGPNTIPVGFAGNESLVTIAQPGAGKTQAHVLPNLLSYEGPIVVLDPKLELLERSAGYRQSQGHRVLVLNLAADETPTHRFNVMDFIDRRPEFIWGSVVEMAEFLIPQNRNDNAPIFRQKAVEMMAICLGITISESETMGRVPTLAEAIGHLFKSTESLKNKLFDFADTCEMNGGSRPMAQSARSLAAIAYNKDTIEDFMRFQSSATSVLNKLRGGVIDRITQGKSDWRPEDLRSGGTTLYIRVPYEEMAVYGGFVQLILYLVMKRLRQHETEQAGLPVTFLLDEVAQLGNLNPIVNMVETGRAFGLRAWMIFQDEDQAKSASDKPALLTKTPKLRLYMNPGLETARRISEELGRVNQIITGREKNLAPVSDLVGEPFGNDIVVLSSGARPLRLQKRFAWQRSDYKETSTTKFNFN